MSDASGNNNSDPPPSEEHDETEGLSRLDDPSAQDDPSAHDDPIPRDAPSLKPANETGDVDATGEVGDLRATEDSAAVQRTAQQIADERREEAARRYGEAADRGRAKRVRRKRSKERRRAYAGVAQRLDVLPLEKVLEGTVALAVVGSVLALGSVHPPVMAVVGVVSAIALALSVWLRDAESARIVGPGLVCWLLAAWSLVQVIPLPMGWLELIAPSNADIWQRALTPFGEAGPTHASISLDPGATLVEATRWFSYGAIFVASARVAQTRGARWVVGLVFATAAATALLTLAHGLGGMTKVYGFYQPSFEANVWHVGPLLNANNLAGLLNLGALCGLGLMLSLERHASPWLVVTGVALIVGVGVISASRGGVALLLVGVVLLTITVQFPHRRSLQGPPVARARWLVLATLVMGVAMALLGGRSAVWNELLNKNIEKLRLIGYVEPTVRDFPVLGIGRGAFESVFPAYQPDAGGVVYTHAENFVTQWVVEWGAPAALLALVCLGYFLRPRRMGVRRSALAAGAWLGALVLLLQNLVDLGLEIPGIVICLAATLGALWGDHDLFREPSRSIAPRGRALVVALGALGVGVTLSISSFALGRHTVGADRLALRAELIAHPPGRAAADVDALRAELHAAMERHPAEPFFALLGAELSWEERSGDAIPWLQRALERSAMNGRAHLLLARVLRRKGATNQALLELRLAGEAEHALVGRAARDAAAWTQDLADLERAAPKNEDAAHYWEALAFHIADRAIASQCDERALALEPTRVPPRVHLVNDIVALRTAGKGCLGDDEAECAARVEEHAEVAQAQSPHMSTAVQMRAKWRGALGDHLGAEKLLAEACESASDAMECLQARADAAAKIASAEPFGEAAKALRRNACAQRDACANINTWIGDQHMARKEFALAVTAFEKAVRENVTNERLSRLANAATEAGLSSRAMRAIERLMERTTDEATKAALQEKRRALVTKMIR